MRSHPLSAACLQECGKLRVAVQRVPSEFHRTVWSVCMVQVCDCSLRLGLMIVLQFALP